MLDREKAWRLFERALHLLSLSDIGILVRRWFAVLRIKKKKKNQSEFTVSLRICKLVNLRVGTLIGVGLFKLGFVAFLLVNEDDGAKHYDLGEDSQERPESCKFVFDPEQRDGFEDVHVVAHIVKTETADVATIIHGHVLEAQHRVIQLVLFVS